MKNVLFKKLTGVGLAAMMMAAMMTGCGSEASVEDKTTEETATEEAADETKEVELTPITVAASATPHAEILEQVKPILAEQGYDLQVTEFEDIKNCTGFYYDFYHTILAH